MIGSSRGAIVYNNLNGFKRGLIEARLPSMRGFIPLLHSRLGRQCYEALPLLCQLYWACGKGKFEYTVTVALCLIKRAL